MYTPFAAAERVYADIAVGRVASAAGLKASSAAERACADSVVGRVALAAGLRQYTGGCTGRTCAASSCTAWRYRDSLESGRLCDGKQVQVRHTMVEAV
eukprot:1151007-Pelagomonas_calceolata.AAC.1